MRMLMHAGKSTLADSVHDAFDTDCTEAELQGNELQNAFTRHQIRSEPQQESGGSLKVKELE